MSTSVKCSKARVCVGGPLPQCEDQQGDGVCVPPTVRVCEKYEFVGKCQEVGSPNGRADR